MVLARGSGLEAGAPGDTLVRFGCVILLLESFLMMEWLIVDKVGEDTILLLEIMEEVGAVDSKLHAIAFATSVSRRASRCEKVPPTEA